MQPSDTLLAFLRQKLVEQTRSTFRLFQAVDMDGDGYVSVQDFIWYCERFSLPRGTITEEQVTVWFNKYVDCDDPDYNVGRRQRGMVSLNYSSFKHFLEDCTESTVVSQDDRPAATVDTVRRALVRYMHSLGYSIHKFYKVCAHGAEFLYEHHLRNILDTRCGILLSNSAWNNLWKQLKSDPRIQHMSIHEFNILLQYRPEEASDLQNTMIREIVKLDEPASDAKLIFKEEGVHDEVAHKLEYNVELDGDVASVMLYLGEKFAAISSPRALFGRIDRRRYNYLTTADFISAVRDLTDIEISEELAGGIFRVVSERAGDGSTHQLMSYQGFLKLLSCQEYLVPLKIPNRPSSTAAIYCKRPLTPIVECALRPPQHGRRATISVPTEEVDMQASFNGAYSPTYTKHTKTMHSSMHLAHPADKSLSKQHTEPTSGRPRDKSGCTPLCLQTGDDQRYTTTALNSLPLTAFNDKQRNKDSGFVTTEIQMETQAQHTECSAFVQDVIKKLRARGESMRVLLSEAFHNRKIISSKELLWFFRSRLGIAVSPLIILQTFRIGGNDTIQIDSVLSVFKVRPESAVQPRSRHRMPV